MNIIKENCNDELIIKKSKFISFIYKIDNLNEFDNIINNLKKEYKDSSHICYAYIIDNKKKYSDDKEPNGTAGLPILNILEKNNLTNVVAIVIRYFGGTKLGAGNLLRAYSNAIKNCLKKTIIIEDIKTINLLLTTDINNLKQLNNITKNLKIINKQFDNKINYLIELDNNKFDDFKKQLQHTDIKYQIKK